MLLDKENLNNTDLGGISDIWISFETGRKDILWCSKQLRQLKGQIMNTSVKLIFNDQFFIRHLYLLWNYTIYGPRLKYHNYVNSQAAYKKVSSWKCHSQVVYKKAFISAYSLTSTWALFLMYTIQVLYYVFGSIFRALLYSFQRENCFRIPTM